MKYLPKDATEFTIKENKKFLSLPFNDKTDFEDSQKGFLGTLEKGILDDDGKCVWNLDAYNFQGIDDPCPDTVNPSLWRQSQLNHIHGLFEVVEGVYQLRNLDTANMTIIESENGIIVIDCMTAVESARAGLELYFEKRGKKKVQAVVITHSHTDHYGGIRGIITEEDIANGVKLYVPDGFVFEVMSENAYAGNIMSRRVANQYGTLLPINEKSHVDIGLGKTMKHGGHTSLLKPTNIIKEDGKEVIDGIEFEFAMTPNTEAPAEMIMYFPQFKMLLPAEIVTHTLHNVYTLRGAQIRDVRLWWKAIDMMIERFGDKIDTICAVHHWPTWGNERCIKMMENQRDTYKYVHDQSLRLANHGYTMLELSDMMELPESLGNNWYARGYYGTLSHDVKSVYNKYLGWFDMNPANLNPLAPEDVAKEYVEFAGGFDSAYEKVKNAFEEGKYRWAAEAGKHLVFADPTKEKYLLLLADIYEQLGYQCEAGTWRCIYLSGSFELRLAAEGHPFAPKNTTVTKDLLDVMDDDMFFEFIASHLNAPNLGDEVITIEVEQDNNGTVNNFGLLAKNGVLNFHENKKYENTDAKVALTRDDFSQLVLGDKTVDEAVKNGDISIEGDQSKVSHFFDLIDKMTLDVNIMIP